MDKEEIRKTLVDASNCINDLNIDVLKGLHDRRKGDDFRTACPSFVKCSIGSDGLRVAVYFHRVNEPDYMQWVLMAVDVKEILKEYGLEDIRVAVTPQLRRI